MAMIRFLDNNKRCYQVHTPETPVLIYLSPKEKKMLIEAPEGQCMMLINNKLPENEIEERRIALNTKDQPKIMG